MAFAIRLVKMMFTTGIAALNRRLVTSPQNNKGSALDVTNRILTIFMTREVLRDFSTDPLFIVSTLEAPRCLGRLSAVRGMG